VLSSKDLIAYKIERAIRISGKAGGRWRYTSAIEQAQLRAEVGGAVI
jgi:hypothetical protein